MKYATLFYLKKKNYTVQAVEVYHVWLEVEWVAMTILLISALAVYTQFKHCLCA